MSHSSSFPETGLDVLLLNVTGAHKPVSGEMDRGYAN